MQFLEKNTPQWGRVLWITDGCTELAVALEFGIRIVHLSCVGHENLFYVQPADRSDGFTEGDWCLYGGHRLWLAPESNDSYYPDNSPVQYTVKGDMILFEQEIDQLLLVRKYLSVAFQTDGSIQVVQKIENISDRVIEGAAWGVNTLDAGGEAEITFGCTNTGGFNPQRVISLWSDTNVNDPRLTFEKDRLLARHLPSSDYLKIGLYSKPGRAVFKNKGQRFTLTFDAELLEFYPDNGCNFELYMCMQFMELESLGKMTRILPGQSAIHTEVWHLDKDV